MLEVPSLIFELDYLCQKVDFISIGSNDLMQFYFAADRENHEVGTLYDMVSVSPLRALRNVVETCDKYDVSISLCGEMGSDPEAVMALMAIGLREISMSAASIGPVKWVIRNSSIEEIKPVVTAALDEKTRSDKPLRAQLKAFLPDEL